MFKIINIAAYFGLIHIFQNVYAALETIISIKGFSALISQYSE
jgi:hypothetical protein